MAVVRRWRRVSRDDGAFQSSGFDWRCLARDLQPPLRLPFLKSTFSANGGSDFLPKLCLERSFSNLLLIEQISLARNWSWAPQRIFELLQKEITSD